MKPNRKNFMTKLYVVAALASTLVGASLLLNGTLKVAAQAPTTGIKNVVLVHGAFADVAQEAAVRSLYQHVAAELKRYL